MKGLSIRYKFVIALLALSAICLSSYILLVKIVFEKDKEASIFESTSQSNKIFAQSLNQHISEVLKQSQSLIHTIENGSFNETSEKIILDFPELLFIALTSENEIRASAFNNKSYTTDYINSFIQNKYPFFSKLNSAGHALINMEIENSHDPSKKINLLIGYDFKKQFDNYTFNRIIGGTVLVINKNFPIGNFDEESKNFLTRIIQETEFDDKKNEFSFIKKIEKNEFLLSYRTVGFSNMYIFTIVPKAIAFSGLYKLYEKSVQFFIIVIFIVLGVAVFMSSSLLRNLQNLTNATLDIAKGNFDLNMKILSNDEFGILSKSFSNMSIEIKRLLTETKEKARMESELKTAQMVQHTLFPVQHFANEQIEIEGLYRSASECGGDWWYYFNHPTGLYCIIADATGHGAGAALITAAAKSAVNLMKRSQNLDLLELVDGLNHALYETAKGEILMTGFIFHLNKNGEIKVVNASHEAPIVVREGALDFILLDASPRLGESLQSKFKISVLENMSNSILFLYTDGITGQVNEKNKEFGDRRLNKIIQKSLSDPNPSLREINKEVFKQVDLFKGSVIQNDDLTLVSIKLGA